MSNSPDHVFYQDKDVTVTKTRIVISGKTYSMANITSVAPYSQSNTGCGCGCLSLGLLSLVGTIITISHIIQGTASAGGLLYAIVFIVICFIMGAIFLTPSYYVEIRSSSTEAERVLKGDKTRVFAIVEAINQAMEARG